MTKALVLEALCERGVLYMADEETNHQTGDGGEDGDKRTGAEEAIAELRREAARHRTEKNAVQKQLDELTAKLAGLTGGEQDPKEAEKKIAEMKRENQTLRLTNALNDVFDELGADRKLTRGLMREEGLLDDLDPTDREGIRKAVKAILKENPKLAKQVAPNQSGGDHMDGGGTKKSMNDYIRRLSGY